MAFPWESGSLWIEHQIACPRASSWSEKGESQDLYSLDLQHVAFRELQLARWKVRVWNTYYKPQIAFQILDGGCSKQTPWKHCIEMPVETKLPQENRSRCVCSCFRKLMTEQLFLHKKAFLCYGTWFMTWTKYSWWSFQEILFAYDTILFWCSRIK